jgi:hypothetical protein
VYCAMLAIWREHTKNQDIENTPSAKWIRILNLKVPKTMSQILAFQRDTIYSANNCIIVCNERKLNVE